MGFYVSGNSDVARQSPDQQGYERKQRRNQSLSKPPLTARPRRHEDQTVVLFKQNNRQNPVLQAGHEPQFKKATWSQAHDLRATPDFACCQRNIVERTEFSTSWKEVHSGHPLPNMMGEEPCLRRDPSRSAIFAVQASIALLVCLSVLFSSPKSSGASRVSGRTPTR